MNNRNAFTKTFTSLGFAWIAATLLSGCSMKGEITSLSSDSTTSPSTSKTCLTATSYADFGAGTITDPYLLCNAAQLASLMNDAGSAGWSSSYQLLSNIDMASYDGSTSAKTLRSIGYYDTLGSSNTSPYTGRFNGAGYTISNVKIVAQTNQSVGFFGSTMTGAQISNLTLSNIDISGVSSVGGLIGYGRNTTVSSVVVTGQIASTGSRAGGLIGQLNVNVASGTFTITSAQTAVAVSAQDASGGFIGTIDARTGGVVTISSSSSSGHLTQSGTNGNSMGGFIGYSETNGGGSITVQNSFSTGNVTMTTGGSWSAAFMGQLHASGAGAGFTINKCYSTGSISVPQWVSNRNVTAGLIGNLNCNTSANCQVLKSYYAGNVSIIASGYTSQALAGLIGNATIQTSATFSVTDSYSSVAINSLSTSTNYVGGIFGALTPSGGATATITRVYASATITGTSFGAFIGAMSGVNAGTWTNSYWNTTAYTLGGPTPITGTSGLTAAQMANSADFSGWDFTTVWISDGVNPPTLR